MKKNPSNRIGYSLLTEALSIRAIPNFRESLINATGENAKHYPDGEVTTTTYPKSYAIKTKSSLCQHIEFALKYEGINLPILSQVFKAMPQSEVLEYILLHPTGKYARKIWFLYEFLTKNKLNIPDCKSGNYFNLLDEELYYTAPNKQSKRHRINNNLLGNAAFCPTVRRTNALASLEKLELNKLASKIVKKYDHSILTRASHYLYTKETRSSFEIEREKPTVARVERYIKLITEISEHQSLDKATLISLQNAIMDPRFQDDDYRATQNYVGEVNYNFQPKLHYISPRPEDVPDLMAGLLDCLDELMQSDVPPVIIATIISFGFVFIHPFEDGNGRIHRYLIHYILHGCKFTPEDLIFPISATMLENIKAYDKALESFSKPLLKLIEDYDLTEFGTLNVGQDTKHLYQYIDYTKLVEYLFECIEQTINTTFIRELDYVVLYDKLRSKVQNIVDLRDKDLSLIVNMIIQNQGKLSKTKRKKYFEFLTEEEITDIEQAYTDCV